MREIHTFAPVFDERSETLILGSFPSVKSREEGFYYGHPRNRFWRVLAAVYGTDVPQTVAEKRAFLLERKLALWDVIESCEIVGSGDASIRSAVPNDLRVIVSVAPIRRVFANGRTAEQLYRRFQQSVTLIPAVGLPSTSPANAAWTVERLAEAWQAVCAENCKETVAMV